MCDQLSPEGLQQGPSHSGCVARLWTLLCRLCFCARTVESCVVTLLLLSTHGTLHGTWCHATFSLMCSKHVGRTQTSTRRQDATGATAPSVEDACQQRRPALRGRCCRDGAAGMALQGWHGWDGTAGMVLQGCYCRDGAAGTGTAGMLLQGWCCRDHLAKTVLQGRRCRVGTAGMVL